MKAEFDDQLKVIESRLLNLDDRFSQQNTRLHELRKSMAMLRGEMELLNKVMDDAAVKRRFDAGTIVSLPPPTAQPPPARQLSAEELYELAYTNFMERNYDDAVQGFKEYVERFPASDLADNAQYWIGESKLLQQRFEEAYAAFQHVLEKFPKGNKVPDALFKKGFALFNLGDHDAALAELYALVERFPASSQASRARRLIERITAAR